jgi:hypothetical protein
MKKYFFHSFPFLIHKEIDAYAEGDRKMKRNFNHTFPIIRYIHEFYGIIITMPSPTLFSIKNSELLQ